MYLNETRLTNRARRIWLTGTGLTARKSYLSLVDQALISVANFLTGFLMARYTEPSEFGAYVLAFSIVLTVTGLQNAVIGEPMTIYGAPREGRDLAVYFTTLARLQLAIAGAVAALAVLAAWMIGIFVSNPSVAATFLGMSAAVAFLLWQEFCRRALYTKLRVRAVLLNDGVFCGLKILGLGGLIYFDRFSTGGGQERWLNGRNVFLVMALAGIAAGGLGVAQLRRYLVRKVSNTGDYLRETWDFGKWTVGSFVGGTLLTQANNFIVAAFAGLGGTATLEAPRLLLAPLQTMSTGMQSVIRPRAAEKYARGGNKELEEFIRPVWYFFALVFVGYALAIAIAPHFWLGLFYGDKYVSYTGVLVLWASIYSVIGLSLVPKTVIIVNKRVREIMYIVLMGGFVGLLFSFALTPGYGSEGAAMARLLSEIIILVLALVFARKLTFNCRIGISSSPPGI